MISENLQEIGGQTKMIPRANGRGDKTKGRWGETRHGEERRGCGFLGEAQNVWGAAGKEQLYKSFSPEGVVPHTYQAREETQNVVRRKKGPTRNQGRLRTRRG